MAEAILSGRVKSGDTPLEEIGLIGVRQMYNSLGTPLESVAEGVRAMKTITTSLMMAEEAIEVGAYFDYLIAALR